MAFVRAYPELRARGIITGETILCKVWENLKTKMRPEFFRSTWTYTGSLVLESLLGETFTNGKRDVDVIDEYQNLCLPLDFKKVEPKSANSYANTYQLDEDKIDFIHLPCPKAVALFDLNCCMLFLGPNELYIRHPWDLLKKETIMNGRTFTEKVYAIRDLDWVEQIKMRLKKYSERGFKIRLCYEETGTPLEVIYNFLLDHDKSMFSQIPRYNIGWKAAAWIQQEIITHRDCYLEWFEKRPAEGTY